MALYLLTLTEREADLVAFALAATRRQQRERASLAKTPEFREDYRQRADAMEAIEWKLDRCPVVEE